LCGLFVVAAACGKKSEESLPMKMLQPLQATVAAPREALAGQPVALARARLPGWARESPRFFNRGGRRFASAVGSARAENRALARVAATDRARADLLRFINGATAGEAITGELSGARVTNAYTSRTRGEVFVRVEAEQAQ
jgi:hypothetical protein